jgi:hypothetical protein
LLKPLWLCFRKLTGVSADVLLCTTAFHFAHRYSSRLSAHHYAHCLSHFLPAFKGSPSAPLGGLLLICPNPLQAFSKRRSGRRPPLPRQVAPTSHTTKPGLVGVRPGWGLGQAAAAWLPGSSPPSTLQHQAADGLFGNLAEAGQLNSVLAGQAALAALAAAATRSSMTADAAGAPFQSPHSPAAAAAAGL